MAAAWEIAEPALRPVAQRHPGLDIVRNARIYLDGTNIVVRARDGSEQRYPVGAGGIELAVHLDTGPWGVLELLDGSGQRVLGVRLNDWLPEAIVLDRRPVGGDKLLERSGMAGLLKAAGVPIRHVHRADDLCSVARGEVEGWPIPAMPCRGGSRLYAGSRWARGS